MSTQTTDFPLAPALQAVLDLFSAELSAVRFPDIDQQVLQESAQRVQAAAAEQARLEAQLQAAREARQEAEEALLGRCQRALAYARVFAEDDPELGRRLEALSLPRGRGKAPPEAEGRPERRRGRRAAASGGLFVEVAVAEPGELPPRPFEVDGARAFLERPPEAEARP